MKRFLLVLLVAAGAVQAQTPVISTAAFGAGEGVNGEVNAVAVQPDGKIIIGGHFTAVNGTPRNNVARLNPDGTLDATFAKTYEDGVNGEVSAVTVQPNGGIIVGGVFTQVGRQEVMNLARYNPDGSIDKAFGTGTGLVGTNGPVLALTVQADGKIVVGGNFTTVFGQPRRSLARLNPDGSLDGPVAPQNVLSGPVQAVGAGADGGMVAAGDFSVQNHTARNLLKIVPAE